MSEQPKIAIVGGGPAGLMLARLLVLGGISSVTVFESDESMSYRPQGGTLDLQPPTGIAAMEAAGLFNEFKNHARFDADAYYFMDKDQKTWYAFGAGAKGSPRPEIDRSDLRRILVDSLPEGMVQWGRRLKKLEEDGTLVFKDGTTESGFDLVVGCEGTWSKVRNAITDTQPHYCGLSYVKMILPDAANAAPDLVRLVNNGNVAAHNEGQCLVVQPLGDGSLYVKFCMVSQESWALDSDPADTETHKNAVLKAMHGWSPRLREFVERAEPDGGPKGMYILPTDHRWQHRRGVTVIGDAAHVMTTYAGEGSNTALHDARLLAAAIIKAIDSGGGLDALDRAVQQCEEEMFTRMNKVQKTTDEVTNLWMFSPNVKAVAPYALCRLIQPKMSPWVYPLAAVAVHLHWFVKNNIIGLKINEHLPVCVPI